MKPIAILGIVLVACGLIALVYQGFTYKSRDTIIDMGPIHATADREHTLPVSPLVGVVAVIAGVGLVVVGNRKAA
jgi:hypothetical protein